MLRFTRWKSCIIFALLTLFLTAPAWGDGMPDAGEPAFTDYGSFLGEYRVAGAFKFYDNTEAYLRMAQFELALMRYRFLKGQIQRKIDYRGLVQMVDLRLRFLKKQMHLTNTDIAAIPPRRVRIPKVKKPEDKPPAAKPAAAKPAPPGAGSKDEPKTGLTIPGGPPGVVVIPAPPKAAVTSPGALPGSSPVKPQGVPPVPPPGATPAAPPGASQGSPQAAPGVPTQKPPDVVTTDTPTAKADGKAKDEKAEEEKEVKVPPPPPGFWERLKIRLRLKNPANQSGKEKG